MVIFLILLILDVLLEASDILFIFIQLIFLGLLVLTSNPKETVS